MKTKRESFMVNFTENKYEIEGKSVVVWWAG